MEHEFFQACYAHPDTGWSVINLSADIPGGLADDFSAIEKGNAAASSGMPVPMGKNETPTCMFEIYCRNNTVGLVRVQYGLSDGQGRPISFSHGYLFPDAYEILKNPNEILCIQKENFADQRVSDEERLLIMTKPGAVNRALIEKSLPKSAQPELLKREPYELQGALQRCGLSEETYRTFVMAVYVHLLSSNMEKNLYIKTDGSEEYAWNLLYLTYLAIPYSMRTLLSGATYLHSGQHNAKLIFCAELPVDMSWINPVSGDNNVMSEIAARRLRERSPFVFKSVDFVLRGQQEKLFVAIESCLRLMGNEKLNTMQIINLAYSFCMKEYNLPEKLPGIIYNWLALPVQNTENWEKIVCLLLNKTNALTIDAGDDVRKLLLSRLETAVTEEFIDEVRNYLA